jgi:transcriptional regulator with XRE-family HTH domain
MNSRRPRKPRRKRGVVLTPHGLERLQGAIAKFEVQQNEGNRLNAEELSELTGVSPSSIRRMWAARDGLDQKTLERIFSTFELELTDADFQRLGEPDSEVMEPGEDSARPEAFRYPSGPLALDSTLYIPRSPIEELAFQEIDHTGCVVRVKAPPQFGKSSLLLRMLDHAQQEGYATALIDLQRIDDKTLSNPDRFLQWFSAALALKLGVEPDLETVWNQLVGSQLSATLFARNHVLAVVNRPVVLAINDITPVFKHYVTAQVFLPLLRSWHEEAGHDEFWQHLRLVVTYSTESYLLLDINFSPFNVGLPLALPEFTAEQVKTLAKRYGLTWGESEVEKLMALVGGHPSLVHLAIYHSQRGQLTLDELLQTASLPGGVYQSHLQQLFDLVKECPPLMEPLNALVESLEPISLDPALAYQLEGAGMIRHSPQGWQISRELYRRYLRQRLSAKSQDTETT